MTQSFICRNDMLLGENIESVMFTGLHTYDQNVTLACAHANEYHVIQCHINNDGFKVLEHWAEIYVGGTI